MCSVAGYEYFGNALAYPEFSIDYDRTPSVGEVTSTEKDKTVSSLVSNELFHSILSIAKAWRESCINKRKLCELAVMYESLFSQCNPLDNAFARNFQTEIMHRKPLLENYLGESTTFEFVSGCGKDFLQFDFGSDTRPSSFDVAKECTRENTVVIYKQTENNYLLRFPLGLNRTAILKEAVEEVGLPFE